VKHTWVIAGAICAIVGGLGVYLWLAPPQMAAASVAAPPVSAPQPQREFVPARLAPTATTTVTLQLGGGLALTLPAGWRLETGSGSSRTPLPVGEAALLASAWVDGDSFAGASIRMTATRVRRHAIPLPRYIEDAATVLAQTPGVTVAMTSTAAALRADGLPAGELGFVATAGGRLVRGYQVVLIDPTGANLVIVNFSALDGEFAAWLPHFRAIVRSLHWG